MREPLTEPPVRIIARRLGRIAAPAGTLLDAEGILNPAVTRDRAGRLLMFPRMVAPGNVSRIGLMVADESGEEPRFGDPSIVLAPETEDELRSEPGGFGCEDPRVTFVPLLDRYLMAYTAFGPHGPRIAFAISQDAYRWTRLGRVRFRDDALNHVPNKDAAFFPEPVVSPSGVPSFAFFHRPMLPESWNGQAPIDLILSLPPERREAMAIAYLPVRDVLRDAQALCNAVESVRVLPVGDAWGRLKNGAGTPPVKTSHGWLSFFHGVDALEGPAGPSLLYRAGILLQDAMRPDRVLHRSPLPFLEPETLDERHGTVNDVVFPTGIDPLSEESYDLYYGAADFKIARVRVDVLLR